MTDIKSSAHDRTNSDREEVLTYILNALQKLRFGTVNVTIHEGKLVQVDITDRKRFQS